MTAQPKTILAPCQKIEGPDAWHFMHPESGKGSGFATVEIQSALALEHREGVLRPRTLPFRALGFWAMDRRAPRCLKAARPLAIFFLN